MEAILVLQALMQAYAGKTTELTSMCVLFAAYDMVGYLMIIIIFLFIIIILYLSIKGNQNDDYQF